MQLARHMITAIGAVRQTCTEAELDMRIGDTRITFLHKIAVYHFIFQVFVLIKQTESRYSVH